MTVEKNGNDFSVTEKFHDWIRNPDWQSGYNEFVNGNYINTPLNQMPGYSSMYEFLSSAFENVGSEIYEKIKNFNANISDIDTCNINALQSMAISMDSGVVVSGNIYPLEMEKLVNILSIPKGVVLLSGSVLTDNSLSSINSSYSQTVTGTTLGYVNVESLSGDGKWWSDTEKAYLASLSGSFGLVSMSAYSNFIESEVSSCLIRNIFMDGIVDDLAYNISIGKMSKDMSLVDDTDDINDLKSKLGVSTNFVAKKEADYVQLGLKKLSNYPTNEQQVITTEINNRSNKQRYGQNKTFKPFYYEKERVVREYINFIENMQIVTNTSANVRSDGSYEVTSYNSKSFFDLDSNNNPVSASMIANATHIIRNDCIRYSYQREYLKRTAQKHAIIGTRRIIQNAISEHIAREFTDSGYWNYYPFPELSGASIDIKNLPVMKELSAGLLGDIKVVEYFDSTEYMNLSTGVDYLNNANPRFWQGDAYVDATLASNFSAGDVISLNRIYNLKNQPSGAISAFLNKIYDMGAVSATTNPSFYTIGVDVPVSGRYGTYGVYQLSNGNTVLSVSADVQSNYAWVDVNASSWLTSPLISSMNPGVFITSWQNYPSASAWIYDLVIDINGTSISSHNVNLSYSNLNAVNNWVSANPSYKLTGWVENQSTNAWLNSPLIQGNNWDIEKLRSEWAGNSTLANWSMVSTLNTNRYGWLGLNTVIDWMHSSGITPGSATQDQWYQSTLVSSFYSSPFTAQTTGYNFNQSTDWAVSSNPFVSAWISGDAYNYVNTTLPSITANFTGSTYDLYTSMANSGMISFPNGGLVSSTLSSMYLKYLGYGYDGTSGLFPPANHKNTIHPSIAYQPFIYNLMRKIDDVVLDSVYRPVIRSDGDILSDLVDMIGDYGNTINSWRNGFIDYSAYQTAYEISNNTINGVTDSRIDRDDPYNPDAIRYLVENYKSMMITNGFSYITFNNFDPMGCGMDDFINKHYSFLGLDDVEISYIKEKIILYYKDIIGLTKQKISHYAVDQFNNVYMLFKDVDSLDNTGKIWMRKHNHPIPFPLTTDHTDKYVKSQLNVQKLNGISNVANESYEFGIMKVGSLNVLWMYGSNSGIKTLIASSLDKTKDINDNIELVGFKLPISNFYLMEFNETTTRYIGVYNNFDEMVIVRHYMGGITATTWEGINSNWDNLPSFSWDDTGYITNGSNLEYVESDGTYIANINFIVYNYNYGFKQNKTKRVTVKYDENSAYGSTHRLWKLVKGENTVSICFESKLPVGTDPAKEFNGSTGHYSYNEGAFDPLLNNCKNKYDNGVTVIDFNLSNYKSYGYEPVGINYYAGYVNLPYIGVNGGNGILGIIGSRTSDPVSRPDLYDFDNAIGVNDLSKLIKFQYFGTINTSAVLLFDNLAYLFVRNDGSDNFGFSMVQSSNAMGTAIVPPPIPNWQVLSVDLSATSANLGNGNWAWTTLNNTISTATSSILYNGQSHQYVVTYEGKGCHKFNVRKSILGSGYYVYEDSISNSDLTGTVNNKISEDSRIKMLENWAT